jgi:hypothetical protein
MPITVDKDGNPIKVTGTTSAKTQVREKPINVKSIYWLQPTTQGHKLALQHVDGRDIIELYCQNANESIHADINIVCNGIYCDDMDSGTLYIYTGF